MYDTEFHCALCPESPVTYLHGISIPLLKNNIFLIKRRFLKLHSDEHYKKPKLAAYAEMEFVIRAAETFSTHLNNSATVHVIGNPNKWHMQR